MKETAQIALRMVESNQTGEARRVAVAMAETLGFGETERGRVAIVATEAATNLVKHARDGMLLIRPLAAAGDRVGIEILSLDRGPGLANVGQAVGDGFSTSGTSGNGLGAMRRLSSAFDVHSLPGAGTTTVATLWADDVTLPSGEVRRASRADDARPFDVGVVSLPHPGEQVCGDAFAVCRLSTGIVVLVADGLGHGPLAAEAAGAVVASFAAAPDRAPVEIIEIAHAAVRHTRGAAVAVARIDLAERRVRYAGAGNISGLILAPGRQQSMVSHSGTVGHAMRRVQEFTYEWPAEAVLVMHSDGLSTSWHVERYPGLVQRAPALLAATLYRDATRGRDDATVVTVREHRSAA